MNGMMGGMMASMWILDDSRHFTGHIANGRDRETAAQVST
jgi:hypothetical protein